LGKADAQLIDPVMLWLLRDLPAMRDKAYRARHNEEIAIPEEIQVDPTVAELIVQHRELQEHFDQVLTERRELGATNVDELKRQITNLEADKARLATKIGGFKRQLSKVKNLDELLRWTAKFRAETDRETRLRDQLERLVEDKPALGGSGSHQEGEQCRGAAAAARARRARGAEEPELPGRREQPRVRAPTGRCGEQAARAEAAAARRHAEGPAGGG
jgi:intraflagellar transport protein 81